jgi:hypothetical protein
MFVVPRESATIRRPDYERMYHEIDGRIEIKNTIIKEYTDKIIKLRAELASGTK